MKTATKAPTNQRTAFAWARRQLTRQLRPLVAAAPSESRSGRHTFCRHERDVRNIARGYLSDDFLDAFPEIEIDGDWPRIAAQMVSFANDFFAQLPVGDVEVYEFHTCEQCGNY